MVVDSNGCFVSTRACKQAPAFVWPSCDYSSMGPAPAVLTLEPPPMPGGKAPTVVGPAGPGTLGAVKFEFQYTFCAPDNVGCTYQAQNKRDVGVGPSVQTDTVSTDVPAAWKTGNVGWVMLVKLSNTPSTFCLFLSSLRTNQKISVFFFV